MRADLIRFRSTGATIRAIPSEYASAAGGNPTISVFDELWGYTSERARRLFDEMVPPSTRRVATRLTVSYAGYTGESELLEGLYKRGQRGEEIAPALYRQKGLLLFWSQQPVAPWQTQEWLDQMREQLRPNAYLRLIENRFVANESSFVEPEWWAACEDAGAGPLVKDQGLPVWVGVDASVKRDSTAVVACAWDADQKKVRLNLTEASSNLYQLVKGGNLIAYPDDGLRKAVRQAVAVQTPRGWRIAKEKQAHRIDVVVALAQTARGAIKGQAGTGYVAAVGLSRRQTYHSAMPEDPSRVRDPDDPQDWDYGAEARDRKREIDWDFAGFSRR